MKGARKTLTLKINGVELQVPILACHLWEVEDEEGFVFEEGYVYETPYGTITTQLVGEKEEVVSRQIDWEALKLPA